jgi:hypothetical protein
MKSANRQASIRLRRIARSRLSRMLAHVLALLLVLSNFAAAVMPSASGVDHQAAAHAMESSAAHHHCHGDAAASSAPSNAQQMPHGNGCPCCAGGACACLHLCGSVLTLTWFDIAPLKAAESLPAATSTLLDVVSARQLRPPIA